MEMRRLAILAAVVVLLLGGGIYLLFLRGGDDTPVQEAGSRFGDEGGRNTGGTLMDTLAPILGARAVSVRGGSDPSPPSAEQLKRAPQDPVAGLFLVGFAGTNSEASFFRRLTARPYGGVLLTNVNYREPQQLSALTAALQKTARDAGHPAPIIAAQQEGGEFNAFGNLAPRSQVDIGNARKGTRASALAAGRQLRALGVGMNLAPNADIAVAGGPAQGRAFSDRAAKVTSAVAASVVRLPPGEGRRGRRAVPGLRRRLAGPLRRARTRRPEPRRAAQVRHDAVRGDRQRPARGPGDPDVQRDLRGV